MECESEKFYLLLSTTFTASMWILSEILASSKCKPNGVFQFVVHGFCISIHKKERDCDIVSETDPLIEVSTPL